MRSSSLVILILCLFGSTLNAQEAYDGIEPGYYTFPILPDQTNYLSGNMGELRPSHFHAGLDIKTDGKTGLSVFSAADGYVSRIRIGPGGYGNCLYINHPNGTTTVYAHLESFDDEIADYVVKELYKRKTHATNLFPKRGQFNFKKGQVIGLSGNTGSSTGPHLHFEIRNVNQEVLDPLRIGFDQIIDKIPPTAVSIGLKTMNIEARVEQEFGRFNYSLEPNGKAYILKDTISVHGKIGIELYGFDRLNGANNRNGIPIQTLKLNDEVIFSQNIDTIRFSEQKNIKVHTNYQAHKEYRRRFNKLYIDDGNSLDFYENVIDQGLIQLEENEIGKLDIELKDAYGNTSWIQFYLKEEALVKDISKMTNFKGDYFIQDNTLVVKTEKSELNKLTLYEKSGSRIIAPAYESINAFIYLIDLKTTLPVRAATANGKSIEFNFADRVPASSQHAFLANTYSLKFSKSTLFDTVYIQAKHEINENEEFLMVNEDIHPLKGSIEAEWAPSLSYEELEKYQIYNISNPKYPSFAGGEYKDGKFTFSFRSFGKFTILKDEQEPTIKHVKTSNDRVYFRISDDLSGIKEFKAEINGKWLLMHYEPKQSLLWSERLDKNKPLEGEFELKVLDNANNESIFNLKLGEL